MRWFKHMNNLSRDEDIAVFLDDAGLEGYGFLMLLMEHVAEAMGKNNGYPELTLPLREWSHRMYCHHHTVSKYLGKLEATKVVTVKKVGGRVKVIIPKLLILLDEYTRKSGHRPDSVALEEKRTRKEGEEDFAHYPIFRKSYKGLRQLLKANPDAEVPEGETKAEFADRRVLIGLVRPGKIDEQDVVDALTWLFESDHKDAEFWRDNVLSFSQLCKKCRNDLTKFQNIHMKWRKAEANSSDTGIPENVEEWT